MTLVQVRGMWLNPEKVIGVWVEHHEAHELSVRGAGEPERWIVTLRCEEKVYWRFTYTSEEDADRAADRIADQVNTGARLAASNPPIPRELR